MRKPPVVAVLHRVGNRFSQIKPQDQSFRHYGYIRYVRVSGLVGEIEYLFVDSC